MLTSLIGKRQELRIDMKDMEGNSAYALCDNFVVDSEKNNFKLKSVGKYSGTAGLYDKHV